MIANAKLRATVIMVDCQVDFMSPDGALSVPNASTIAASCLKLAERVWTSHILDGISGGFWKLIATQDWHTPADPSFAVNGGQWPIHCVQYSKGAQLTWPWLERADYNVKKTGYSAFENTGLHDLLKFDFGKVIICGIALDYCVKATALDAKRLGFDTIVAIDATAPVTVPGGMDAVIEMEAAGIAVMKTEEILRGN